MPTTSRITYSSAWTTDGRPRGQAHHGPHLVHQMHSTRGSEQDLDIRIGPSLSGEASVAHGEVMPRLYVIVPSEKNSPRYRGGEPPTGSHNLFQRNRSGDSSLLLSRNLSRLHTTEPIVVSWSTIR